MKRKIVRSSVQYCTVRVVNYDSCANNFPGSAIFTMLAHKRTTFRNEKKEEVVEKEEEQGSRKYSLKKKKK